MTVAGLIRQADDAVRARDLDTAGAFVAEADRLAPHDPLVSAFKVHIARQRRSRPEIRAIVDAVLSRWFESVDAGPASRRDGQVTRSVTLADIADHGTALHYIDHVIQVMTDLPNRPSARPCFYGIADALMMPGADWSPVTHDGQLLVHGMGINQRRVSISLGREAPRVNEPAIFHPDHRVIVIGGNDNWYHFVLDYLPRLLAVAECGLFDAGWRVGLSGANRDRYSMIIRALGIAEDRVLWLDPERAHHFARAIYISNMGLRGIPHNFALALLRRYLLPKLVDLDTPVTAPKRLFISRAGAAWRRLLNERELYPGLERRGFEILHPEGLALERQIELFRPASLIVGAHGAGLVNMVWSARAPAVVELSPLTAKDTHFSNLARCLGGTHHRLRASREETVEIGLNHSDFRLEPDSVFALIDDVIARAGA